MEIHDVLYLFSDFFANIHSFFLFFKKRIVMENNRCRKRLVLDSSSEKENNTAHHTEIFFSIPIELQLLTANRDTKHNQ